MFCLITQEMSDNTSAASLGSSWKGIAMFLGAWNIHSGNLGLWAYTDAQFGDLTEGDVRAAFGPDPDVYCRDGHW
jgi:hypothetical protein